ncbi:MAG: ABC transporter permease [Bauldia sp.]
MSSVAHTEAEAVAPAAWRRRLGTFVPLVVLVLLAVGMPALAPIFHWLFPALERPVYTRASFVTLTLDHIAIVVAASMPVIVLGVAAGIGVTRQSGREFAGILDTITAIGQTFPPAAVLAIAVPLVGYGPAPTLIALIAYGILPVVDNTIAGLRSVAPAALDAAAGMGFTARGRLWRIELPLAAPVILAGIRTSVMIAIGTATIGSTVGALTLGSPIIEGLTGSNTAYVLQGALLVGALAIATDRAFAGLDVRMRRRLGLAADA